MGNRVYIYHNNIHIGTMNSGLSCFAYLNKYILSKYNQELNIFNHELINEQLDIVYRKCAKHEEIQMLLFLNDESEFTAQDIPYFKKAIDEYPENINENPKNILSQFLTLLEKYKDLKTSYKYSDMAIAVKAQNDS